MSLNLDDVELIRSFRSGDSDAFTHVVDEHRASLVRHARRRLHDPAAAEDAVQETFIRAYRSFDRLRDDSQIRAWLYQICSNVCNDEANRRKREVHKAVQAGGDRSTNRYLGPSIDEQLGFDVDAGPYVRALDSLPESHRSAFVMRCVDDLAYDEIARVSATSEQNVRARVSRARSALRALAKGVVAVPAFLVAFVRRPSQSAAALEKAESTHRLAAAGETTVHASKLATQLAPVIETANAVVVSGQQSAPLLTKAAVGIGAIGLAVMSTGSESIPPPPTPVTAVAASTLDIETPATLAPVTVPVATSPAPAPPAPTPPTPPPAPPTTVAAIPVVAGATLTADVDAPPDASATTTSPATTAPPSTIPLAAPIVDPRPAPEPTPEVSTPESAVEPAVETTVEPAVETPSSATPEPVPTTVAEPVPQGGSLSANGISVTPSGPRLDLSGPVSLQVGTITTSGSLSGRISVAAELDADGRQRIDGVLTLQLDDAAVDVRIAGHATGLDATGDQAATSFSLAGQFRATGGDALFMVGGGAFSGSFGPGSLSLQLAT